MCKACDGYPYEKAKYAYPKVDDWEDAPHKKGSRKEKTKKDSGKHPGCFRNDGGAHVYVIVQVDYLRETIRFDRVERKWVNNGYEPHSIWIRVCIGCSRVAKNYGTYGGSPVGRYFNKEDIYEVISLGKKPYNTYSWSILGAVYDYMF